MHMMSLGMMNSFYGEELEKFIGEVIKIDVDNDGIGWGPYLWVKVWMNISRLIIRGKIKNFLEPNHVYPLNMSIFRTFASNAD